MEPIVERVPSKAGKSMGPHEAETELRRILRESLACAERVSEIYTKNPRIHESVLFLQRAVACLNGEEDDLAFDPSVQIDWQQFRKILKQRREQANLGQKELAAELDISPGTVRALESGQRRPSRDLLLHMLALPSLGLRMTDIAADATADCIVPTSWLAPHYSPSAMTAAMVVQLNSVGGSLEQTSAYLDNQSAKDFLDIASSQSYLAAFGNVAALDQVAQSIAAECGAGGIDVIALGCGDAVRELRLVEGLLGQSRKHGISDVRVFLLDVSHSLLTVAHENARTALAGRVKQILALHGNFHDLPKYPLFSERDTKSRTRVFTMLGCTMANLDNEVRFFRETMNHAAAGDFFVVDFNNAYAPADQPDKIRQADPAFELGIRGTIQNWLRGPLERYVKGLRAVNMFVELNTDGPVRGSYEITHIAQLQVDATPAQRRLAIFRVKRYDVAMLEDFLRRSGWEPKARLPYGGNDRGQITLSLLKRM